MTLPLPNAFSVVLVEPQDSRNVGAVARAMKNLGFTTLHLVAPRHFDQKLARGTACWAEDVVDSAQHHQSLQAALASFEDVVGFSAREGRNLSQFVTLSEWTAMLGAAPLRRTALVYGREDNGLSREEADLCRLIVRIPSHAEFPSFNLAQAVLLTLWELRRALGALEQGLEGVSEALPPADWQKYAKLDELMESVLHSTNFYRPGTPNAIRGMVKNLLRRMQLDEREMRVVLGIVARIEKGLRGRSPTACSPGDS